MISVVVGARSNTLVAAHQLSAVMTTFLVAVAVILGTAVGAPSTGARGAGRHVHYCGPPNKVYYSSDHHTDCYRRELHFYDSNHVAMHNPRTSDPFRYCAILTRDFRAPYAAYRCTTAESIDVYSDQRGVTGSPNYNHLFYAVMRNDDYFVAAYHYLDGDGGY